MPDSMKEYFEKYFLSKLTEKEVREAILTENPVPGNLRGVPELGL